MTPAELIAAARTLLTAGPGGAAVRYRHQGRNRNGLDCIGMLIFSLETVGILPPEFERRDYGRLPTPELLAKVNLYCTPAPAAAPGILVLIRWPGERRAGHAALCTGETLIHCDSHHGKVVEHGYREPWLKMTESVWQLPGVRYG